jgi:hypothetical protein
MTASIKIQDMSGLEAMTPKFLGIPERRIRMSGNPDLRSARSK